MWGELGAGIHLHAPTSTLSPPAHRPVRGGGGGEKEEGKGEEEGGVERDERGVKEEEGRKEVKGVGTMEKRIGKE